MVESDWHYAFSDKRIRGEWFALSEDDVAAVLHDPVGIDRWEDGDQVDRVPDDDRIA